MILAVVLFSATDGWSLPPCQDSEAVIWTDCFGTFTWDNGDKYVGEWKDGFYCEGEFKDDFFYYKPWWKFWD